MKTLRYFVPILALIATFLTSCSSVPVTGRTQMNLVSETKVAEMSILTFEQMKTQMPISNHTAYNEMLTNVGNRISQQVFSQMPLAEWEFVIFDRPEVNAFAMPGGKVGIFMGLFQVVKTEDELAAVVAHEIAHVTARHTHERISQQMILQGFGNVIGTAASLAGPVVVGSGNSAGLINLTPSIMGIYGIGAASQAAAWDRDKEAESDHIGLIYMARAGYDPNAAITVMERMVELDGGGLSQDAYGSTHPSSIDRLDALHGYLDEAMEEYETAKQFQF